MYKTILVLFFGVILLSSCSHKDDVVPFARVDIDTACDPNTVYFVNDVQPIINSSCAYNGCHDVVTHADGIDLSSYSSIMSDGEIIAGNPNNSEFYEEIEKGEMPPNGALSSSQQQLIHDWILQGAKNNECVSGNCDSVNVNFSTVVMPILASNCQGCHNGSNPAGGISITNYNEVAILAHNGKLLATIKHLNGYSPMPKNGNKLNDCSIAQIQKWINDGYPNN